VDANKSIHLKYYTIRQRSTPNFTPEFHAGISQLKYCELHCRLIHPINEASLYRLSDIHVFKENETATTITIKCFQGRDWTLHAQDENAPGEAIQQVEVSV
jgi:hypothetical protein